jgi:hypothetical protein
MKTLFIQMLYIKQPYLNPESFLNGFFCLQIERRQQQDINDFLHILFDSLPHEITQCFHGLLINSFSNMNNEIIDEKTEIFFVISIDIQESNNL